MTTVRPARAWSGRGPLSSVRRQELDKGGAVPERPVVIDQDVAPTLVTTPARWTGPAGDAMLSLMRRLGKSNWLASFDGDSVAARSSMASAAEFRRECRRPIETITALMAPQLVPLLGTTDLDGTVWLLSEHVPGASLRRLLSVATLTPIQAGYIAMQLLAGVARLHEFDAAHGRLHAANVLIGRDGDTHLTDWAPSAVATAADLGDLRRNDVDAVRALLHSLAHNADRPFTSGRSRGNGLVA
ncbi:MAG: hypothetical protein JWO57_4324, partial [Pseudonocardiales bacterium]|nr:hypothetical protein [Pseudonocardiales bacterium]